MIEVGVVNSLTSPVRRVGVKIPTLTFYLSKIFVFQIFAIFGVLKLQTQLRFELERRYLIKLKAILFVVNVYANGLLNGSLKVYLKTLVSHVKIWVIRRLNWLWTIITVARYGLVSITKDDMMV